ncbi:MAG: hypothetical protein GXP35_02270 [Actinobacteria bacterium]|nr:hypothetical protein [Actinomycetota bacterium]
MSSCCSTDLDANAQPCAQCGTTGPVVGHEIVQPHRSDVDGGNWQHCSTLGCPVVYYLDTDVVTADHVRTQVGHKALDKPTPVCFCFSHTRDDLATDLAASAGVSSIKLAIKAAVADGFCACEHLNPTKKCCLADVHRTLKSIAAT